MRRFLSFAMAAVLLMAGCAKDVDSLNGGDTVAVTFSATLPIEVSRTVGDGSQATLLKYAIYSTEGVLFDGYDYQDLTVQGNVANLTLDLVKGQSYKVVFWAQNAAAPYTFDRVAKTVTISYDDAEMANDEIYDAFYVVEPITVKGPFQKQVTLRRPFAQINLGATKDDVEKAKALGVEIDKSQVTFTDVPTVLNLVDGTLGDKTTNVNVTFNYNTLPGNDLTVNEVDYAYIAANYILADANTNVTNVTFAIKQGEEVINEDVTVPAVNYKRNFRTNILGRLLTSSVDFNIVIDGTPEGDMELSEETKLALAMQTSGEYTLTQDLELSEPLVIEEGVAFTLNLNGKTIGIDKDIYADENGKVVKENAIVNNGTLEITGGTIASLGVNGGAAIYNNGVLTATDVTVMGAPCDDNVKVDGTFWASYAISHYGESMTLNNVEVTSNHGAIYLYGDATLNDCKVTLNGRGGSAHVFYVGNGAEVVVNSGDYTHNGNTDGSLGYLLTGTTTTINGGTFNASNGGYGLATYKGALNINGGTFNSMPIDWGGPITIKGGTFVANPSNQNNKNYVAEGYKAMQSNGKWVVVADEVDAVVSDAAELSNAISSGSENVVLGGDVVWNEAIENDANINLNGNTFEATTTIKMEDDTDLTMVGGSYEVNGTYGHVDVRPTTAEGSVLVFEDVDFSYNKLGKTYGPSTNRLGSVIEVCAAVADAHTKILFKNCTFNNAQVVFEGMSGKTGSFEAEFEGCSFTALTSSAPIYVQNYVEGTIKLTGCTFNLTCTSSSASAVSVSSSTSTAVTLTATNNTLNAVAATPYTYDASKGETEEYTIKVNGTPNNIKFISMLGSTTSSATETGTVKSGIAQ